MDQLACGLCPELVAECGESSWKVVTLPAYLGRCPKNRQEYIVTTTQRPAVEFHNCISATNKNQKAPWLESNQRQKLLPPSPHLLVELSRLRGWREVKTPPSDMGGFFSALQVTTSVRKAEERLGGLGGEEKVCDTILSGGGPAVISSWL